MQNFAVWGERESGATAVAEGHVVSGRLQRKARNLDGLARLVSEYIPPEIFAGERERVYSPWVTFVAFLGQVLTRGSACRESVRRVQSWCVADRLPLPDENTSGYCQARGRLNVEQVKEAHEHILQWFEERRAPARWRGRPIRVLDGCGVSMPDTAENRKKWPYAGGQKPGCGFPTAQLVGLFCLATGRLVRFAFADWKAHEIPLARKLIAWIQPQEIVLADRAYCGWGFMALLQRKKVDVGAQQKGSNFVVCDKSQLSLHDRIRLLLPVTNLAADFMQCRPNLRFSPQPAIGRCRAPLQDGGQGDLPRLRFSISNQIGSIFPKTLQAGGQGILPHRLPQSTFRDRFVAGRLRLHGARRRDRSMQQRMPSTRLAAGISRRGGSDGTSRITRARQPALVQASSRHFRNACFVFPTKTRPHDNCPS